MENGSILMAEIIGPAGAGKSTLSALLNKSNLQIEAGITIWGLPRSLLAKSTFISVPTVARILLEEKELNISNSKQIIRLRAFYQHLIMEKQLSKEARSKSVNRMIDAVFLDEGIVFALSKLRADWKEYKGYMQNWEKETLNQWSKVLNTIIWLDAPNDILIERIRIREKSHRMKFQPADEIHNFLDEYRSAYTNIVKRFQSLNDVTVIKFDTAENSLETIAAEIDKIVKEKISTQVGVH